MSKEQITSLSATARLLPPLVEIVTNNDSHLKCHIIDVDDDYVLVHMAKFSVMLVPCSVIVTITPFEAFSVQTNKNIVSMNPNR